MAGLAGASPVGVGILGATGYTGAELLRLLASHPGAALRALGSRQHAGQKVADVLPGLPHLTLPFVDDQTSPEAWRALGVDVVFAALPHGAFAARAAAFLQAGLKVVDLSADFRLRAASDYPLHYAMTHPAPALLGEAVYGLTEWCGPELAASRLVANPGCYATAILLGVLPAVAAGLVSAAPIVVNAISGVSGAGRAPKQGTHFGECGNSVAPYRVGDTHAHLGEMQQALAAHGCRAPLVFNPHLAPMARGIVATTAVPLQDALSYAEVRAVYAARYANQPFVHLLDGDALPETRHVRGSNRCDMALRLVAGNRLLLVFTAIDNLQKGAAGQAVQNWNRLQGWSDTVGLSQGGWSCA